MNQISPRALIQRIMVDTFVGDFVERKILFPSKLGCLNFHLQKRYYSTDVLSYTVDPRYLDLYVFRAIFFGPLSISSSLGKNTLVNSTTRYLDLVLPVASAHFITLFICLLYTSPSPRDS